MLTLLFDDVRLLKYLTFRAAMAAGVAFALTLLLAPRIIAWLRRKKVGENVEKGDSAKLDEMHRSKNQTPTMGGIFLLLAALGSALLVGRPDSALLWGAVVILVAFGLVGFVDDYVKLTHPGRKGGGSRGGPRSSSSRPSRSRSGAGWLGTPGTGRGGRRCTSRSSRTCRSTSGRGIRCSPRW